MENVKSVYILTNGCPENRIDSARMIELIKASGFNISNNEKEADLIIFNSCGLSYFTQENSVKIYNKLKRRKKASARLLVLGCLPKINKNRLKDIYDDLSFGSDDLGELAKIIKTKVNPDNIKANYIIPKHRTFSLLVKRFMFNLPTNNLKSWFYVMKLLPLELFAFLFKCLVKEKVNVYHSNTFSIKVSTGCINACSFCAVKLSRGKLRSKPINTIIEEFKEGLNNGYRDFALIGTDLGSYGHEINVDLSILLKKILKIKGDYEIRLRNINPKYLVQQLPAMYEIFKTKKITYISSAFESGNNRILKLMKRDYQVNDFKNTIQAIKKEFPFIQVTTQVMVGFPGETDEEFYDSVRLIENLDFDYIEVYLFQPRPGTKAYNMKEQVPVKIAKKREHLMHRKIMRKHISKKLHLKRTG